MTVNALPLRLLMTGWAAGLLGVLPLPARAQETFGDELHATRSLVERQHHEEALKQLQGLRQAELSAEQKLTVALYEGLILASMGPLRQAHATAAFRSVLLQDPQVRLPLKAPSRIAREFEEIRAQVLAEKRAAAAALGLGVTPLGVAVPDDWISRNQLLIPTVTGGGLLVSGGIFWALARREQSRLRNNDPTLDTDEKVRRTAERGKTYQTLSFSLLGASALSLGIATNLYMKRKSAPPVTLGVSMSGTSVLAYGSWP